MIVLFSPKSEWQFEKVFPCKSEAQSAFERSLKWALELGGFEKSFAQEKSAEGAENSQSAEGAENSQSAESAENSQSAEGEGSAENSQDAKSSQDFEKSENLQDEKNSENPSREKGDFSDAEKDPPLAILCFLKNESLVKKNANDFFGGEKNYSVFASENWSAKSLLEKIASLAKSKNQKTIIFANAAAAFLDLPLSKRLLFLHEEYKAEYTFADGYPAGFAPEILDAGAAAILAALCENVAKEAGAALVTKDAIFDVVKSDINSFEIETEIASRDFRLLRMNFLCEEKLNFLSAKNLAKILCERGKEDLLELDLQKTGEENAIQIAAIASESEAVLKTVPAFYNVQINGSCKNIPAFSPYADFFKKRFSESVLQTQKRMPLKKFSAIVSEAKRLSGKAVFSLSLFGDAVLHPELDFFVEEVLKNDFSVLIEIDGALAKEFSESKMFFKICEISKKYFDQGFQKKIIFIILLDAFEKKTFSLFHGTENLESAKEAAKKICENFSETYVQFTRVSQNESELENFFRFWSKKESATFGKLIIQKYDNFCGALPSEKTADLSPVVREPCWHLRRDMEILFDGSVPICREVCVPNFLEENFLGNVFDSSLEEIWQKKNSSLKKQVQKNYENCCKKCDEYYVFNF